MRDIGTTATWLTSTRGKSPPQQSRTLRRRLKKLDAAVARVAETDRLFFERHPHRQYRVRLTSRAEIERQEFGDGPMTIPPGHRMFTVIRNIAPNYRLCLFVPRLEAADIDLDEAAARELFARVAEPHREVEVRMCKAAGVAEAAAPPHALQSMTPAQRAFVERELPRLTSTDECPLCGRPFANNALTCIGVTEDGTAALVGECCQAKIKSAWGHGIYQAPPAQGGDEAVRS